MYAYIANDLRANKQRMLSTLIKGVTHVCYTRIGYTLDFYKNFMYSVVYEFHLLI
jgi:hypothetical protein